MPGAAKKKKGGRKELPGEGGDVFLVVQGESEDGQLTRTPTVAVLVALKEGKAVVAVPLGSSRQ